MVDKDGHLRAFFFLFSPGAERLHFYAIPRRLVGFSFALPRRSPLTVAAVMTLAHSARNQKQDGAQGENDGRIAEHLGRGAPPLGSGRIGAESTRFLSTVITRVIHLHEDPKPFAGLCYSLLSGMDNGNGLTTGSGVGSGNRREAGGGEDDRGVETAAPVSRACRGK